LSQKKILFFATHAGSTASLLSLYYNSPDQSNVIWCADKITLEELQQEGIKIHSSKPLEVLSNASKFNIGVFVLCPNYDLGLTNKLLKTAKKSKIPTIFITDHWGKKPSELFGNNDNPPPPDFVFAVDKHVSNTLISNGVDPKIIIEVGHLGISRKIQLLNNFCSKKIYQIKERLNLRKDSIIVLIAMDWFGRESNLSINQFEIISEVHKGLKILGCKDYQILLKLHPSQDIQDLENFLRISNNCGSISICTRDIQDWISIAIADLVIGSNSVIMPLSIVANKPTVSIGYIPNSTKKMKITIPMLNKYIVDDYSELVRVLNRILSGKLFNNKRSFKETDFQLVWNHIMNISN